MPVLPRRMSRPIFRLLPGARRLLARRPWIYWVFVVCVAGLIAVSVSNALGDVRRERDTWGETAIVRVAVADIVPGDLLDPLIEARTVPIAMVPPGALDSVPVGGTARQRIGIGEIVVQADVGPGRGPLALLPVGWLAVSIDETTPASFAVGDRAVVFAAGAVVAADAIVIDVLADAVVVGVPEDDAAALTEMVAQRLAIIALRGG